MLVKLLSKNENKTYHSKQNRSECERHLTIIANKMIIINLMVRMTMGMILNLVKTMFRW